MIFISSDMWLQRKWSQDMCFAQVTSHHHPCLVFGWLKFSGGCLDCLLTQHCIYHLLASLCKWKVTWSLNSLGKSRCSYPGEPSTKNTFPKNSWGHPWLNFAGFASWPGERHMCWESYMWYCQAPQASRMLCRLTFFRLAIMFTVTISFTSSETVIHKGVCPTRCP